ncbi:MAG: porin family protein [Candidatus Thiodiazotropha sp. (ex Monitilora ramsayi)]|nr:porin family protein [Candidatus Thiodiazotropha sp. (ex Monitilora ramsayi)]
MRQFTLILFISAVCLSSSANAYVGLGVSAKSNDAWVYLPINMSDNFRIEPALRYYKDEQTDDIASRETTLFEISVGLFRKSKLTQNTGIYYGGRLGYIQEETSLSSTYSNMDFDTDGFSIAPTIGFEYFFTDNFSVGAEAEWFYRDLDGSEWNGGTQSNFDKETTGTSTRLILRFNF